ncbi:hypothetical protein ASPZODRAFT_67391 [Penicilliopsis zonata CBS 506.65]|uniref:NAD-dependent epimerase/dehydratase domain-containing protein n=1 Tax=Penicilliopsis zonata CBS 506.65 TaxID=1073090 RepID=A0A1L9SFI2_9EURO|nr:hypothetical protein ASPZODRAFT_67391 [Penicilliopsis zonata CBS 506.65]OJJ45980.1 hypothetical protein ASPZODRAFT_67391 [Penicilliopsis zonata CBS 506.65]
MAIILVTGASGFIASHVIRAFLQKGYNVRGTVRSEKSAAGVRKTHSQYAEKLSLVVVPDMTVLTAFDEAVQGVDGVVHLASPFIMNATDFENELFVPAIQGTNAILTSIQKHSPNVTRVVITSSFGAVVDPTKGDRPGYTYTEADWNPITTTSTFPHNAVTAYLASKTCAEQAAWDFVESQKPSFSITTLCPPLVYGPVIHAVETPAGLNTSSADIYRLINGSEKTVPPMAFWAFVDVRDAAHAHLRAFETPEAAGQRYLVSGSSYTYQQICDIIRAKFPALRDSTPEGAPGEPIPSAYKLDTRKVVNELGMKFRPLEETVTDTVMSLLTLK